MATATTERQRKSHRQSSAEHERKKSHATRLVEIAVSTASLRRRANYERNLVRWLRYYFADDFTRPLTDQQVQMAEAIHHAARYGGDQAIAASRGEGKTMITECVVMYEVLTGRVQFPIILAATGPDSERILANIKTQLENNERLIEDYGEVCQPIQALEGLPNRCGGQLVRGVIGREKVPETRSRIKWAGRQVVLPTIPGKKSRARGQVIATRGLDAAVRGIRYGNKRPDLAVIDDPETRELAESLDDRQREKLERKLEQDIAGLAGQNRRLARVMLTTLMTRECVSARYTDPEIKPSWHGHRFRMIEQWPEHTELWEEYVAQRRAAQHDGDKFSRRAHQFYKDHRAKMDAGAEVANPYRFIADKLPDGTQQQLSTLQYCYDLIADIGMEAFETEFQNNPPEETGPIESGITANRILTQVSGYPRKTIPPGCTILTQGIDVRKLLLHWAVLAWRPDATSYVIDYGVQDVHGTIYGSDEGADVAIRRAIHARMSDLESERYETVDKEQMDVSLSLIDAGWRTDTIYHACREIGPKLMPAMGHGTSSGCTNKRFSEVIHTTYDRKPGDGWLLTKRRGNTWLVNMDTDRYKAFVHDRWMTPTDKPGTMFLWGMPHEAGHRLSVDEKSHMGFAHHIVAEIEVEEVVKGVLRRRWKQVRANNHWLDAVYMASVAANMRGIKLMRSEPSQPKGSWYAQPTGKPPQSQGVPHIPGVPKSAVEADGWVSS